MIKIIPAIDIIEGKCVRLSQGNYDEIKIYNSNPVEVAMQFADYGVKRLHLVDLDGAKAGKVINFKVLEAIASKTKLSIDFGGGVKSIQDLMLVFNHGATQITAGSIAIKEKETVIDWIKTFGAHRIILGADVKNEKICVAGWSESSETSIFELIDNFVPFGIKNIISTDIARDGMFSGPAVDLYNKLSLKYPFLNIIASGGVASINDIELLEANNISSVIVGKAIYENRISLKQLSKYV